MPHRKYSQKRENDPKSKPHIDEVFHSSLLSILRCVNIAFVQSSLLLSSQSNFTKSVTSQQEPNDFIAKGNKSIQALWEKMEKSYTAVAIMQLRRQNTDLINYFEEFWKIMIQKQQL